jgi:hypothetical protein
LGISRAIPILDEHGDLVEWFGAATDITGRRKAEQHLELVANELNHRVKNNLAMIQAIAAQTFRNSDTVSQAQASLSARINALAQASDLLIGERWVGVSLSGVIEQALHPHANAPHRYSIDGPELQTVTQDCALAFACYARACHERAQIRGVVVCYWEGRREVEKIRDERKL